MSRRHPASLLSLVLLACSSGGDNHLATGRGGTPDGGTPADSAGGGGITMLPASLTARFPVADAPSVCPDAPLRLTFSAPPALGGTGKIQLWRTGQADTPVAAIDMAADTIAANAGGTALRMPRPVYVDGNDVLVYWHSPALGYGQTYYVTIDAGAIAGPNGDPLSIADSTAWRFTVAPAAPSNLASLTVALDGSGDFCTVQGAVDALPANNTDPARISIAIGTYREIVHFRAKNNVTLHGEDRKATIIAGTNNNNLNPSTATRALVGIDTSTGVVVENLTIHNLTPQGGSQAEALRMQTCDQCIVRNADILSLQDTLLWSGRLYATNCYIEGNVDFVWGTGAAYFKNCEIKTVVRAGYDVQSRNGSTGYGYVFVDSKLTSDPGITGNMLGRIDVSSYPASHVAYINCQLGDHISPVGWLVTGAGDAGTPNLRFWEYQSVDASGNPVDVSRRLAGSVQLTADQAAMMRDPAVVLNGWTPSP
jgi:pectin methylesterase-like acyl-CoA thioesterase